MASLQTKWIRPRTGGPPGGASRKPRHAASPRARSPRCLAPAGSGCSRGGEAIAVMRKGRTRHCKGGRTAPPPPTLGPDPGPPPPPPPPRGAPPPLGVAPPRRFAAGEIAEVFG